MEFELPTLDWHNDWKGRLIVSWPPPDRSWWRWGDRNTFPIEAIATESEFAKAMPSWDELVLSWQELSTLPSTWATALGHWRGIYLITDVSDGRQYVRLCLRVAEEYSANAASAMREPGLRRKQAPARSGSVELPLCYSAALVA